MTSTLHPANPRAYPTCMAAILAGAAPASMTTIDDWVEMWHEGRKPASQHKELHDAIGLDFETYGRIVGNADADALKDEVARRRAEIDDPAGSPLMIKHGVTASAQEAGNTNATLTDLPSGHSISIAVIPPDGLIVDDPAMLRTMLRTHFARLVDNGYKIGVEVGPNNEDPDADEDDAD